MPGIIRLNNKDAIALAEEIERNGGNADSLRAAVADVNNPKNGHSSVPAAQMGEEEHVADLRSKSPIEKGEDLECMMCHEKFDQLISGTCEVCFREWALTIKRTPAIRRLI